jgi:iron(III) transport system ATP-binding protein
VASDGLREERLVSDGLIVTKPTTDAGNAHIEVKDLVVQYGHVTAVRGVSFAVRLGEQLTLLGPSGCGKTTTLRAVAGLEPPTSGEIVIGGTPVFSSVRRINIPAERRGLSMVFQSYAIWPHMTVFDNVAYGLRVRRMGAREIAEKVGAALDMVQMGAFAQRSASKLSGGQQQRVALARAFVFSPSVLLFDEPLSNLDAKLRAEMRIELRELQHRVGITSVYVTHDLEEALAISDRVVVMRDGEIAQIGSPFEIYNYPRNAFVADFVGSANLIRGRHRPECGQDGLIALETAGGTLVYGTAHGRPIGAEGVFSVRTIHLGLSREAPPAQANVWPVRVRRSVFQGDFTQYQVDWEDRQLVVRCTAADPLAEGEQAYLTVDPRRCVLLEEEPTPA